MKTIQLNDTIGKSYDATWVCGTGGQAVSTNHAAARHHQGGRMALNHDNRKCAGGLHANWPHMAMEG